MRRSESSPQPRSRARTRSGDDRLSHLDSAGRPTMVDVGDKVDSDRSAEAECRVRFPAVMAARLRETELRTAKGAVIDVAVVAGTLAVKRCPDLIPFCHPLPIDGCQFAVEWRSATVLDIRCRVRTRHRTGVEMEALTGVTVAALTVYDMCKALGHGMVIGPARLRGKRGGKRDFSSDAE